MITAKGTLESIHAANWLLHSGEVSTEQLDRLITEARQSVENSHDDLVKQGYTDQDIADASDHWTCEAMAETIDEVFLEAFASALGFGVYDVWDDVPGFLSFKTPEDFQGESAYTLLLPMMGAALYRICWQTVAQIILDSRQTAEPATPALAVIN